MPGEIPTTKIPWAEWIADFDASGSKSLWRELLWLTRHGIWCWATNTRPLIFGAGRLWHDGPHWFAHFGWVSVSLSAW